MRARRWWLFAGIVVALLGIAAVVAARQVEPYVHGEIIRGLSRHLDGRVTLDSVHVRLLPRPAVSGRGLVVRFQDRDDIPPLVVLQGFAGTMGWRGLIGRHVSSVTLEGLELTIPPKRRENTPGSAGGAALSARPEFTIGRIEATNARLMLLSNKPDKDPKVWDVFSLTVERFSFDAPTAFQAVLTNPIPEGRIETVGTFGPWATYEPSLTPVNGTYRFTADLGTIKGIAGSLLSEGLFNGPIERIVAKGTTRTPDFRIPKLKAASLPLDTSYDAVIDGTNGDVELPRVDARLGRSRLRTRGAIVGTKGIKGKRITLDVSSDDAQIEDFLNLTLKQGSPMTGKVHLQTDFDVPPGDADVIDKLKMRGQIEIKEAHFAHSAIQDKVDELSRRGQGRPGEASIDDVASNLRTGFALADGVVQLSDLTYAVRGALIALKGTYNIDSGAIDFLGAARLDASASQTVTGFRHFLLKPFDPLFRKGGAGTRLAIEVKGTVEKPDFNLNVGRTLQGK